MSQVKRTATKPGAKRAPRPDAQAHARDGDEADAERARALGERRRRGRGGLARHRLPLFPEPGRAGAGRGGRGARADPRLALRHRRRARSASRCCSPSPIRASTSTRRRCARRCCWRWSNGPPPGRHARRRAARSCAATAASCSAARWRRSRARWATRRLERLRPGAVADVRHRGLVVLKDIWGLDGEETTRSPAGPLARWCAPRWRRMRRRAEAKARRAAKRAAKGAPGDRTFQATGEKPALGNGDGASRTTGLARCRPEVLAADKREDVMLRRTFTSLLMGAALTVSTARLAAARGADDLLGGMGSGQLSAGTRQRVREGDRRQGHGRDDAVAGLPDQGLHRVQRQGRRLRHGRRRLAVARRRLDRRPLCRPDRLLQEAQARPKLMAPATVKTTPSIPGNSGKYWAIPLEGDAIGWAYRKDWFEDPKEMAAFKAKYGYDLGVPKDYKQLRDIAEFFYRPGPEALRHRDLHRQLLRRAGDGRRETPSSATAANSATTRPTRSTASSTRSKRSRRSRSTRSSTSSRRRAGARPSSSRTTRRSPRAWRR